MERILDKDEHQEKKDNSWFIVIVVNIMIIGIACLYTFYTSDSSLIYSILQFLVMINTLLLFLSFSYHKNYWKKWLLMVIIGVVLFLVALFIQVAFDISKMSL